VSRRGFLVITPFRAKMASEAFESYDARR